MASDSEDKYSRRLGRPRTPGPPGLPKSPSIIIERRRSTSEPGSYYIRRTRSRPGDSYKGNIRVPEDLEEDKERRKKSKRNSRPSKVQESTGCDDAENALNDFYGGTYDQPRPRPSTGPIRYAQEELYEPRPLRHASRLRPQRREDYGNHYEAPPTTRFLEEPPYGSDNKLWARAAKPHGRSRKIGPLEAKPTLVVPRRGQRYRSRIFTYVQGKWDDEIFASEIKRHYRELKTRQIGPLQKLIAYKTIAFVYFLQLRCIDDGSGADNKWKVEMRKPITPFDDIESRNTFMYLLRHPPPGRKWTATLDEMIVPGAVVDLEIMEAFDSVMIYWGLFFAVLLSLASALAYGFAMDNDFGTGFSIASWILTAFGFFAAVIAAGEYFGLEKPTSFQTGVGMEEGRALSDWSSSI